MTRIHAPLGRPAEPSTGPSRFTCTSRTPSVRVQPKLVVGPADDAFELEADRAAESIISGDRPVGLGSSPRQVLQRQCAACKEEEEPIRGKGARPGPVSEHAAAALTAAVEGGTPLSRNARAFFEPRFGHRFDRVRLHDDSRAAELSSQLGARAFTYGEHIFFGHGQRAGNDRDAQRLLAHELAHTIQQGRSPALDRAPPASPGPRTRVRTSAQVALPVQRPSAQRPTDFANAGLASSARALDSAVRSPIEAQLGQDLSAVRVHDDRVANASASALGAEAFTVGRDIVFRRQMSGFAGGRDRELLAHELVHTVQSGAARGAAPAGRARDVTRHEAAEREADRFARGVQPTAPREHVAAGTVLPALQTVQRPFHDPNFCYHAGSPRDATHPDMTKVVAVMQAEIETPETCDGNVVLRTSVLQSDWGSASADFEAYGGGFSQGLLDDLQRNSAAERADFIEEFHLDTCHAAFNRCHLITFTEGSQKYIFAEASYRPRISATSSDTGTEMHDTTPAPTLVVRPCDNLTPSGCR